jgi:transposase
MWNPAPARCVSREDREWLEALVRSGKTPQRVALRAHLGLRAAEGRPNHALAKELGISRPTVLLWRQRYIEAGVAGLLKDAPRPGRKKRIGPAKVEAIVNATLQTTPSDVRVSDHRDHQDRSIVITEIGIVITRIGPS